MRIGQWVIMKMHPDEKELRRVSQLTPALRELVARMARAESKDAVQDILEHQGLTWFSGSPCVSARYCRQLGCTGNACAYAAQTGDLGVAMRWKHHTCYSSTCPLGDGIPYAPADLVHAHLPQQDHDCQKTAAEQFDQECRDLHASGVHCDVPWCTVCGDQS